MMQKIATNTVGSRIERPSKRSLRTRRELVDAARTTLEEGGITGLTVKAVTARADMGHGTFYHHFSSTEDILAAVVETSLRESADDLWRRHAASEDKAWVIADSLVASINALAAHPAIEPMLERPALLADALGRAVGPFALADVDALIESKEIGRGPAARMLPLWTWMLIGALHNRLRDPQAAPRIEDDLVDLTLRTLGLSEQRITEILTRLAAQREAAAKKD